MFEALAVLDLPSGGGPAEGSIIDVQSCWPPEARDTVLVVLPFAAGAGRLTQLPSAFSFVRTDEHGLQLFGSIIAFRNIKPLAASSIGMLMLLSHSCVWCSCARRPPARHAPRWRDRAQARV